MPQTDRMTEELAFLAEAMQAEAAAVSRVASRLDRTWIAALDLLERASGGTIVSGMGKSGLIGRKISATFASLGQPSHFLHPAEAMHGDLGRIRRGDVVMLLSASGETEEVINLAAVLQADRVATIGMSCCGTSTLARLCTVHLNLGDVTEACPLNLAPTASTTAALAMGDALAVALIESRGFTREDFALSHPGGRLGRRLLLRVADVMHTGEAIPRIGPDATLSAGLLEMTRKNLGMIAVVDGAGRLLGVFTDGDLRRAVDGETDIHHTPMHAVMTSGGRTIGPAALAAEAVHLMERFKITALPVVDDEGMVVGALNVHNLLRAGVM